MTYLVYCAEPIDQVTEPTGTTWVAPRDWTLFRPNQAFDAALTPGAEIERVNRAVLATANGVIAFLPRGVATIGVPAEIEWALIHRIPVAIVTDNHVSIAIQGFALRGAIVTESVRVARDELGRIMSEEPGLDQLSFVKTHSDAILPSKVYADDVGLDLHVCEDIVVPANQFRDVRCGIIANLRPGTWGLIVGRSSTLRKHHLWVYQGVIDPSFRGELMVGVWNFGGHAHRVKRGDRLGQLLIMPSITPSPVWTTNVFPGQSDRGSQGFGSTGA